MCIRTSSWLARHTLLYLITIKPSLQMLHVEMFTAPAFLDWFYLFLLLQCILVQGFCLSPFLALHQRVGQHHKQLLFLTRTVILLENTKKLWGSNNGHLKTGFIDISVVCYRKLNNTCYPFELCYSKCRFSTDRIKQRSNV